MKIRGTSAKRLEDAHRAALTPLIDVRGVVQRSIEAVNMLIENTASRIEWNEQEHRRQTLAARIKGDPPPAPISLLPELEAIGRIISNIRDLESEYGAGDPDKGAREICKILELARKDFGYEKPKIGATVKEAPEDKKAMDIQAGDETRQNTTQTGTVGATTDGRRRLGRGLVRRGSG